MAVVRHKKEFGRGLCPQETWEFYLNDGVPVTVYASGLGIRGIGGAEISMEFKGGQLRIFMDREILEHLIDEVTSEKLQPINLSGKE